MSATDTETGTTNTTTNTTHTNTHKHQPVHATLDIGLVTTPVPIQQSLCGAVPSRLEWWARSSVEAQQWRGLRSAAAKTMTCQRRASTHLLDVGLDFVTSLAFHQSHHDEVATDNQVPLHNQKTKQNKPQPPPTPRVSPVVWPSYLRPTLHSPPTAKRTKYTNWSMNTAMHGRHTCHGCTTHRALLQASPQHQPGDTRRTLAKRSQRFGHGAESTPCEQVVQEP